MIGKLYARYKEQINYVVVGCLTTLVSLVSYYLGVCFFFNPLNPFQLQIANVISWICAVSFAYVANRRYVFESNGNVAKEATQFVCARLSTLVIDMGCMALLVNLLRINDKLAKLLVQIIVFVLNYIFSKLLVFKESCS